MDAQHKRAASQAVGQINPLEEGPYRASKEVPDDFKRRMYSDSLNHNMRFYRGKKTTSQLQLELFFMQNLKLIQRLKTIWLASETTTISRK
jgi:hypothetical protein